MAPSSGRLKRPLTLKLDVGGDNLKYLDVAKAFFDLFGPASIRCCQPKSRGLFHVTCSTNEDYSKILGAGSVKIGQGSFQVSPVDSDELMITVIGVPFELDPAVVSSSLRPYGDVVSWEYEADKEYPQLTNGNRIIKLKVRAPVPNVIMAGSYRVNVQYRGVKRQCYKCGASEHLARECTGEDRRWVQKAADRALEEYENSLQASTSKVDVPGDELADNEVSSIPDPDDATQSSSQSKDGHVSEEEHSSDSSSEESHTATTGPSDVPGVGGQANEVSQAANVSSSWADDIDPPPLEEFPAHPYADALRTRPVSVEKLPLSVQIPRKTVPAKPTVLVPNLEAPTRLKTQPKRPGTAGVGPPRKK